LTQLWQVYLNTHKIIKEKERENDTQKAIKKMVERTKKIIMRERENESANQEMVEHMKTK
jgi:hypothetical protein